MESWSEAYLERKVAEARAEEERVSKKKREDAAKTKKGKFDALTIIKWATYIWAARLGILGLGFFFPLLGVLTSWFWDGSSGSPQARILEVSWEQLQERHVVHPDMLATTLQQHYFSAPLLIRSVPVAGNEAMRAALHGLSFPPVNVHDKPHFTYLDSQSSWARRHPERAALHKAAHAYTTAPASSIRDFPLLASTSPASLDDPEECVPGTPRTKTGLGARAAKADGGTCPYRLVQPPGAGAREHWWHLTLPLVGPTAREIVSQLAPALNSLGAAEADFRLWVAKVNATATPHYDTADNVFVQLGGSKTFLIATPEAHRFFRLHPVLHPSWRQSQRPYLITMQGLLQASREKKVPRSSLRIWQVTLQPGDALFLPAYFSHSVTAGPDSISLNAWIPSEAAVVYDEVRRLVPMPYMDADPTPTKLASLGAALSLFLEQCAAPVYTVPGSAPKEALLASSKAELIEILVGRHRSLAQSKEWCGPVAGGGSSGGSSSSSSSGGGGDGDRDGTDTPPGLHAASAGAAGACTGRHVHSESKASLAQAQQTATTLALLLQASDASASVRDGNVRALLVLDWVEEVLDGLLGPESSPCSVMQFVSTCLI